MAKLPKYGEKKCPACAEIIKLEASVCKHCGHKFSASSIASDKHTQDQGQLVGCGCLLVGGLLFFVISQCQTEDLGTLENSPAPVIPSMAQVPKAQVEASALSSAQLGRVCRAAIAALNGHSPAIMRIESNENGLASIGYRRPSDGKLWRNQCRVSRDRVLWRTVDAFGPGSGLGRWRTDPADERVTYAISGNRVTIAIDYGDGRPDRETFTVK